MMNTDSEYEHEEVKIITNIETYNKPLPKGKVKWFYRTLRWRLFLNLKLQPENDEKLWTEHRRALAFCELQIPELNKEMEQICIQISTRYCAIYEIESYEIVPTVIKQLIGKRYLFVEPSIFKEAYLTSPPDSPKSKKIKWKNKYIPSRCEDGQIMDTNSCPPRNSLILESVASLSD